MKEIKRVPFFMKHRVYMSLGLPLQFFCVQCALDTLSNKHMLFAYSVTL